MAIGKRHTGVLLACFAALLAALATPALAAKRPGALDRGFNGDGKVVTVFPEQESPQVGVNYRLPFEFSPGRIAMAAAGGGKLVAANGKAVVAYLADGRRNPRFGGNGAVPIGPIEGSRFQLADVAVDSRGRVVVAGTTRPLSQVGMTGLAVPGPLSTTATIRRYLPSGQLDPSFGSGGVLQTTLGAAPATFEGKPYREPSVAVVGLAIDAANRPIVTGSAVAEIGRCPASQNRYEASQAIVARLTDSGTPDPTFAGNGIKAIGGLSWLGLPALTSAGILSVGANVDPCPRGGPDNPSVLASLGTDGNLTGFSSDGVWSRPFTRISDLAVAPSGRIVLLTRTLELRGGEWVESAGKAVQLRRDGSFDSGFGSRGRVDLPLPKRGSVAAIATDSKGRVLLAGNVFRKSGRKKEAQSQFLLMRLTAAGERDLDFGRGGRVATGFGPRTNVRATDVLVDPAGRIVVGGKFSGQSTGSAFAAARYLGTATRARSGPGR